MDDIQRAIEGLRYCKKQTRCPKYVIAAINTAISAMQELQQYRQIGTPEKCVGYKIHSQNISALHNCNDCGRRRDCKVVPRLGGFCRINCYLWKEKVHG